MAINVPQFLVMSRQGFHTVIVSCSSCNGTGKVRGLDRRFRPRIEVCERCQGTGFRTVERLLSSEPEDEGKSHGHQLLLLQLKE